MGNKKRYFADKSASAASSSRGPRTAEDAEEQEHISDSELLGETENYHRADRSQAKFRGAALKFVDGDETSENDEEEVLGLDLQNDDENLTDEEDALDDEHDGEADARDEYWGKHASSYYNTDYVGKDTGELDEEDVQLAEREQEEAGLLQGKLAQQFEAGFAQYQQLIAQDHQQKQTGDLLSKGEAIGFGDATHIISDVNKLSDEEKTALLQRKLPGYEEIFADLRTRLGELNEWLLPSFQLFSNPQVPFSDYGKQYIAVKYKLCLSFCRYAVMCFALYNEGESIAGHPVLDRIAETRTLLKMMDKAAGKFSDEMAILRGFISGVDQVQEAQQQLVKSTKRTGKAKAAKKQRRESASDEEDAEPDDSNAKSKLGVKLMGDEADDKNDEMEASEDDDATRKVSDAEDETGEADDANDTKRPVTYQISKNKGLTPYRKKEYRNSRIRHKHKFKRAQVRRKGQAKEYRPETKKYGGELGGIKAHISRSVKF